MIRAPGVASLAHFAVAIGVAAFALSTVRCERIPDGAPPQTERPRILVTTDGEIDDKASFLRFLLYTTDFDVAGLVYTNSVWHPQGNGTQWMHDLIDTYGEVYDNLAVHDPRYPRPEQLESVIYVGQMEKLGREAVGEGMDTPGSDRIVEVLLDDDPRPVWLQAWGGLNNIAQALYRIKASHPDQQARAFAKARVYAIAEQDDLREWMAEEVPNVLYILNGPQFWRVIAYAWDRLNPLQDHEVYTKEWIDRHIRRGPLGSLYFREVQEEGDSPAFFHVMETGLRSTEDPSWGGWGGRFEQTGPSNLWLDAADDGDRTKPLWRFIVTISEDFAARMAWTVTPTFAEANHPPRVLLVHAEDVTVQAGEQLTLDASPSMDPDGDELAFTWWIYTGAGTYPGEVQIRDADSPTPTLVVPADAAGHTLHVICEVRDAGDLPFTRYRRIIAEITE
jgi:hypothetical protein